MVYFFLSIHYTLIITSPLPYTVQWSRSRCDAGHTPDHGTIPHAIRSPAHCQGGSVCARSHGTLEKTLARSVPAGPSRCCQGWHGSCYSIAQRRRHAKSMPTLARRFGGVGTIPARAQDVIPITQSLLTKENRGSTPVRFILCDWPWST